MLVVNIRHSLLLTDYNGKRYAFYPGKPVEISPEIYNSIVKSKHINADDIRPYVESSVNAETFTVEESEKPEEKNEVVEVKRKPGRPRGK